MDPEPAPGPSVDPVLGRHVRPLVIWRGGLAVVFAVAGVAFIVTGDLSPGLGMLGVACVVSGLVVANLAAYRGSVVRRVDGRLEWGRGPAGTVTLAEVTEVQVTRTMRTTSLLFVTGEGKPASRWLPVGLYDRRELLGLFLDDLRRRRGVALDPELDELAAEGVDEIDRRWDARIRPVASFRLGIGLLAAAVPFVGLAIATSGG